jgi:hypothetical protein
LRPDDVNQWSYGEIMRDLEFIYAMEEIEAKTRGALWQALSLMS